jgi:cytochrome c-type biogenesis protein
MDAAELSALVFSSGFLDGIHPCGFAVLLFFIAFLLFLKRSRTKILAMGAAYIAGVFLTYFLIGIGIFKAITLFPGHFFAYIGGFLLALIGLISIHDGWTGKKTMKIPAFIKPKLNATIQKATLPAAFVAGLLVGLCAFPCAGGIYVAVLGLLSIKTTFWPGVGYLAMYNLAFVLPLILTLLLASSPGVTDKLEEWEKKNKKRFSISLGLAALTLSVYILWSVVG